MTKTERVTNELIIGQAFCEQFDGHRIELFDRVGIPKGWVINGKITPDTWLCLHGVVIPLRPGGRYWGRPKKAAQDLLGNVTKRYNAEVMMLMVSDDETEKGYSASFVLTADLKRNPVELIKEMGETLRNKDDSSKYLSNMKRTAFMAITGQSDTK